MSTLSSFREGFSPKYQDILNKTLIGMKIANTRLEKDLSWGKTVKRAIIDLSDTQVRDVTRYSDRTIGTLGDSDESLTINKQKAVDFKLDSWDKLQNGPLKVGELAGKQSALKLRRYIDADIFAEVLNAFDTFDDGDIGNSAGDPIDFTISNAAQVLSDLQAKLLSNDIEEAGDLALIVDPYFASIVNQTIIGKNIQLTDLTLKNGYSGPLLGFSLYISNNLTFTADLGMATNPTADDTVVIAGVTFTFVASPSDEGDVDIGSDAEESVDNLVLAINGGTEGTAYVELTDADRAKLTNLRVVATDNTTSIGIKAIGASRLSVSETLTDETDAFSKKTIHCFAGRMKSIDVVVQQDVMPDLRKEPKQKTVNVLTDALYGLKTFADGAQRFLDLQIEVS